MGDEPLQLFYSLEGASRDIRATHVVAIAQTASELEAIVDPAIVETVVRARRTLHLGDSVPTFYEVRYRYEGDQRDAIADEAPHFVSLAENPLHCSRALTRFSNRHIRHLLPNYFANQAHVVSFQDTAGEDLAITERVVSRLVSDRESYRTLPEFPPEGSFVLYGMKRGVDRRGMPRIVQRAGCLVSDSALETAAIASSTVKLSVPDLVNDMRTCLQSFADESALRADTLRCLYEFSFAFDANNPFKDFFRPHIPSQRMFPLGVYRKFKELDYDVHASLSTIIANRVVQDTSAIVVLNVGMEGVSVSHALKIAN